MKIENLLGEFDELIEKKASQKTTPEPVEGDDDITKLAQMMIDSDQDFNEALTGQKKEASEIVEETPFEKIAHSAAIIEATKNLAQLKKVAEFKKTAMDNGYSEEAVDKFMEEKNMIPNPLLASLDFSFLG